MIKNNLILNSVYTLIIVSFFGCNNKNSNEENEILITKAVIEKFLNNPSNNFYTNCIYQKTLPIVFNKEENLEQVKKVLNLNNNFNTEVKKSENFIIPDTLFPKLNIITQKKIDSLEAIQPPKNRRTIYNELDCLGGLLSVTKPIFNSNKTKAFISLYFTCSGICEEKGIFLLNLENNSWVIKQKLDD